MYFLHIEESNIAVLKCLKIMAQRKFICYVLAGLILWIPVSIPSSLTEMRQDLICLVTIKGLVPLQRNMPNHPILLRFILLMILLSFIFRRSHPILRHHCKQSFKRCFFFKASLKIRFKHIFYWLNIAFL